MRNHFAAATRHLNTAITVKGDIGWEISYGCMALSWKALSFHTTQESAVRDKFIKNCKFILDLISCDT